MKALKIDHIGVAVKSIEDAKKMYQDLLGLNQAGSEKVRDQKVTTAFFPLGDTQIELLESTSPDGPIARYLEKRGEGVHHIAFRVKDLEEAITELKAKGIQLIDEEPRRGAAGARIAFLHPKFTFGLLVELCERE
jgi:methylmalonyl-CoA/ethylmalonyl-CoA epimerase